MVAGRTYTKRRRATSEAETRQRIVEATVALHGTIGPARTTISAIAERAGVQRLTVYRHFPDERAIFAACTSHFAEGHPPPDPAGWAAIAEPRVRLYRALDDTYRYYAGARSMLELAQRDLPLLPALAEVLAPEMAAQARLPDLLMAGWDQAAAERVLARAVLAHALAFSTWHSLVVEQRLTQEQTIALMLELVCAVVSVAGAGPRAGD